VCSQQAKELTLRIYPPDNSVKPPVSNAFQFDQPAS